MRKKNSWPEISATMTVCWTIQLPAQALNVRTTQVVAVSSGRMSLTKPSPWWARQRRGKEILMYRLAPAAQTKNTADRKGERNIRKRTL